MLHPHSELRLVSHEIGYGVFATRRIARGTVTWVRDDLDRAFSPEQMAVMREPLRGMLEKYTFVDRRGDSILCWDHARYMNHSCAATCLAPGYDFEIAVRDVEPEEELTDDYGMLNLDLPFPCRCGRPDCRGEIRPDDADRLAAGWDATLREALLRIASVRQPLWELVREKDEIARVLAGKSLPESCRANFIERHAPARLRSRS